MGHPEEQIEAPMLGGLRRSPGRGRWLDRLGAGSAAVCAVHCAALPISVALLPALGLGFMASHEFEVVFIVSATVLGTLSAAYSRRRHGRFFAWPFLIPGLAILWLQKFVPVLHDDPIRHAVVMTIGGTLVAIAHIVNLRLAHGHVHDASCRHQHN